MAIEWLYAPKEAASDEELVLLQFLVHDGDSVQKGDTLLEVEGSKSVFDIIADFDGIIYFFKNPGEVVQVGQVICCICTEGEKKPSAIPASHEPQNEEAKSASNNLSQVAASIGEGRYSDSALRLVYEAALDPNKILVNLDFVTKRDVENFLKQSRSQLSKTENDSKKVVFLGGGFGATLAFEILASMENVQLCGVFDDGNNMLEDKGVRLLGSLEIDTILQSFQVGSFDYAFISIQSNMKLRKKLYEFCRLNKIPLLTLIHKKCSIANDANIGEGCLIMDNVRIGNSAILEPNVFVSGTVNIDHHCYIGANTTFGPSVSLSGAVNVGQNCSFGTLVGVESGLKIGSNSIVTSGSIVQKDVPENSIVKTISKSVVRANAIN